MTNVPILHTMSFFYINKSFAVDLRHCLQLNLCRRNRNQEERFIYRLASVLRYSSLTLHINLCNAVFFDMTTIACCQIKVHLIIVYYVTSLSKPINYHVIQIFTHSTPMDCTLLANEQLDDGNRMVSGNSIIFYKSTCGFRIFFDDCWGVF